MMKKPFLLLILIPCFAQAEVIRVGITWASNKYSLTRQEAMKAYRMAAKSLRQETDAKPKLVSFQASRYLARRFGSGPDALSVNTRHDALDVWKRHFELNPEFRLIHLVIVPPIDSLGAKWIGGISSGICTYDGIRQAVVLVNGKHKSILESAAGVQHEVGHAVGAGHDTDLPATAMNPNSIFYTNEAGFMLPFSQMSKAQIASCLDE